MHAFLLCMTSIYKVGVEVSFLLLISNLIYGQKSSVDETDSMKCVENCFAAY